jgi:hypothetical protein
MVLAVLDGLDSREMIRADVWRMTGREWLLSLVTSVAASNMDHASGHIVSLSAGPAKKLNGGRASLVADCVLERKAFCRRGKGNDAAET